MKILTELPPEWIMTGCMSQFRIDVKNTFWTYGDTIYNPGGKKIPDEILAHEAVHMRQQAAYEGGPEAWWKEYLINPDFRYEQELQAHGVEYYAACQHFKDRNAQAKALQNIAARLSGPLYQTAVSRDDARKAIREIAKAI